MKKGIGFVDALARLFGKYIMKKGTGSIEALSRLRQQIERATELRSANRLAEAATLLESAAETARGDPLLKIMELSPVLARLGGLYIQLAEYPRALEVLNEGVKHLESLFGPASPDLLDFHNNLAAVHMHEGRHEEARQALLAVVSGRRHARPADRLELAKALNNLSRACAELELKEEARRHIEEAYGLLRSRVEPGDPLLTAVLQNLAVTCSEEGRLTAAAYFYQAAVENAERNPAENALEYATAADGLAVIYRRLMRQREGVALAECALTIRAQVLGKRHPDLVASMRTLGLLYYDLGSFSEALTYLKAAYQGFNAIYGQGHPSTARAIFEMLSASRKAGPDHDTELDLRDMVELARGIGGPDNPLLFQLLVDLAALLDAKGETEEAGRLGREGTRVFHNLKDPAGADLQPFCRDLAGLLFRLGEVPDALALLESAVRADDRFIKQVIVTRDDAQRRRWLRLLSEGAASFVRSVVAHGLVGDTTAAEAAWHFIANRKGLVSESFLAHDDPALLRAQPELTHLVDSIRDFGNELADVQVSGMSENRSKRSVALKQRLRALSLELEAHTKPEHQPQPAVPVDADRVSTRVPADSALVEFYAVRRPPDGNDQPDREWQEEIECYALEAWATLQPPERYVAFVLRSSPEPALRMFDLGDAAEIDRLVHSYLVVLNHGQTNIVPREQQYDLFSGSEEELSRALRRRVFDPLTPYLKGCRTIIVAPDGVLCRLPFATLLEDGELGRRLIERFTFGYVTTGRDLIEREGTASGVCETPLILGDPDYDLLKPGSAPPEDKPLGGIISFYFPRLKGTADEAWEVSRLVGGRRLVGRKASEAALRECHSPAILHIATHGYYVRPKADGIVVIGDIRMAKDIRPEIWQAQILGYAENPLLRSGLALAGTRAWARGEPLPEEMGDGLFNSMEVAQLDLKGTELVVLSACSTALGDVTPGEGVAGLLQALRVAGARTTAAALWQISDESTTRLIRAFYERLMGELPVAPVTALCEAQRQLLRSGEPAWRWGALVCYGGLSPLLYRPPGEGAAQSE